MAEKVHFYEPVPMEGLRALRRWLRCRLGGHGTTSSSTTAAGEGKFVCFTTRRWCGDCGRSLKITERASCDECGQRIPRAVIPRDVRERLSAEVRGDDRSGGG